MILRTSSLCKYSLYPSHMIHIYSIGRDRLTFLWIAVPYLQKELDNWASLQNLTSRRANKNKILPHGIPHLILTQPLEFNVAQFKVSVPLSISSRFLCLNLVTGAGERP